jgi:hypothetical protein
MGKDLEKIKNNEELKLYYLKILANGGSLMPSGITKCKGEDYYKMTIRKSKEFLESSRKI